jgi:hypothetical protein
MAVHGLVAIIAMDLVKPLGLKEVGNNFFHNPSTPLVQLNIVSPLKLKRTPPWKKA